MKEMDQIAWQKEVILEEYLDLLEEKAQNSIGIDEDYIEDLLIKRNPLQ